MRPHPTLLTLLMSTLGCGPAAWLGERVETRSEPLPYGAKLWVQNRNGPIHVTGWDKEEVGLQARIADSFRRKVRLAVQRVGPDLAIEARLEPPGRFTLGSWRGPGCDMTLQVPRRVLAHFRTCNGPIAAAALEGYARCETTNGKVAVEDLAGEVLVETTNGAIEARRLRARIRGTTTNGRIRLEDVDGGVRMQTTNGGIRALRLDGWGEGIRLETTNGHIQVELGKATGEIRGDCTNGSVNIDLPHATAVEVRRHSAMAKVPGRHQPITLETTNGGITVR